MFIFINNVHNGDINIRLTIFKYYNNILKPPIIDIEDQNVKSML